MPFALPYLILPIVLHQQTRSLLPKRTNIQQHNWIQKHPEILIGFADRMKGLAPYVREAILFGLSNNILIVSESGYIKVNNIKIKNIKSSINPEAIECCNKASFVGKWMALSGNLSFVFALWGVRI